MRESAGTRDTWAASLASRRNRAYPRCVGIQERRAVAGSTVTGAVGCAGPAPAAHPIKSALHRYFAGAPTSDLPGLNLAKAGKKAKLNAPINPFAARMPPPLQPEFRRIPIPPNFLRFPVGFTVGRSHGRLVYVRGQGRKANFSSQGCPEHRGVFGHPHSVWYARKRYG